MTRLDLVPGTLCDARMWSRLTPLLGDGFEFNYVPLYMAQDRPQMRQILSDHCAPQANIVAFSLGVYMALEFALAHPERVKSLVLIAGSAQGLSEKEKELRERTIPLLERTVYAGLSGMRLREILHPTHKDDQHTIDLIQQMALDLGKDVLITQFRASMNRPDVMDRLHEITCPVLLVGAHEDKLVNPAILPEMQPLFPNASLRLYEGTGHMIPLEVPELLAADLKNFFDGQ
ncbi:alpha/beta fold hydrolase [Duganella aceris]|uniref:Alpha/beta hydrolase n=1 Tax=Duganella aceris TaxID=2703883 RepID=A0ABX0FJR2_9BURK|nr:alpha/beta hydrolase [Duganella aceris]NGZ84709.1 alpha/beta hydrolase [Duganella aceris]